MVCNCTSCPDCGGSGSVWRAWDGEYLGNHRCDDLDEMTSCDNCGGSGIESVCEECRFLAEKEEEEQIE